jgi:DNA-binding MarR family transcriptional regulator
MGVNSQPLEEGLYAVIRHVRPLHGYLATAVAQALEGRVVTMPMRAVLEVLDDGGPQTVPTVARSLTLTRQFVQRLVDACAAQGLVEDRPNPAHRRSPLVALTDAGRTEIREIKAGEAVTLREVAAALDPDDVDACLRVVSHLTDSFRRFVTDYDRSAT